MSTLVLSGTAPVCSSLSNGAERSSLLSKGNESLATRERFALSILATKACLISWLSKFSSISYRKPCLARVENKSCHTFQPLQHTSLLLRGSFGTIYFGLCYEKTADGSLTGYSDSYWAGDNDDGYSTSSQVFMMAMEQSADLASSHL